MRVKNEQLAILILCRLFYETKNCFICAATVNSAEIAP
jgi:hypothetical protein